MTMVIDLAKILKKHKYTKFAALNIIINVIIYFIMVVALRYIFSIPIFGVNYEKLSSFGMQKKITDAEKKYIISKINNLDINNKYVKFDKNIGVGILYNEKEDYYYSLVIINGKYNSREDYDSFLEMMNISLLDINDKNKQFYEIPNSGLFSCRIANSNSNNQFLINCTFEITSLYYTYNYGNSEKELINQKGTLEYFLTLNKIHNNELLKKDILLHIIIIIFLLLTNAIIYILSKKIHRDNN